MPDSSRSEAAPDDHVEETAGMRAVFWAWGGIIAVGLFAMIVLPAVGR